MLRVAALLLFINAPEQLYHQRKFQESLNSLGPTGQETLLAAMNHFQLDELDRASVILAKLTQQHPENSEYFDWLGKIYGKRAEEASFLRAPGLATKARDAFEQAVRLNGKNKDALGDLFDYYLDAPGFLGGGTDKAEAIATRSKTIDPVAALQEQGRLAEKRKNSEAAASFYRQAIRLAPQAPGSYILLGRLLSKQGKGKESDAVFLEANKANPNVPRLWYAQAEILVAAGREKAEARKLLERYLKADVTAEDPPPEKAKQIQNKLN